MNTKFVDDLSSRVYDDLGDKFIREYLNQGIPLPDEREFTYYLSHALGIYVSPEEQEQFLISNLGDTEDNDVNTLLIKTAIKMAVLDVQSRIRQKLMTINET